MSESTIEMDYECLDNHPHFSKYSLANISFRKKRQKISRLSKGYFNKFIYRTKEIPKLDDTSEFDVCNLKNFTRDKKCLWILHNTRYLTLESCNDYYIVHSMIHSFSDLK